MKKISSAISIAVLVLLTLIVFSCKEEEKDTTKPTITVVEPENGDTQSLALEPEVHVEFTVTDNQALKQLKVTLTDGLGTPLISEDVSVSGLSAFSFHDHISPTGITVITPLTLVLKATDKSGNEEVRTVGFFIGP